MGINDPPIWIHTAIDSIPGVSVSHGYYGLGSVTLNFLLGSFDAYPHTDEMATSAASFKAYEADGSEALDYPEAIETVALKEVTIHLPSPDTEDTEAARAAAERALPDRYGEHLMVTLRPLADDAWAPHVKLHPDAREALDHDDLRAILQHIVREHPAFDYNEAAAGEYITKEDVDNLIDAAERLRGE